MRALVAWIQQLGFLVFFAGLVQILLPDNDLRKVARLVIGLVLILAVIEPVIGWLDGASFLDNPDSLGVATWFPSGEPYVRQGEELAASSVAQLQGEWRAQAEREIAALVALVPGVNAAEVIMEMGTEGIDAVHVRLQAARSRGGVSGDADDVQAEIEVEGRVRRLVEALLPQVAMEQIRVVWVDESVGGR